MREVVAIDRSTDLLSAGSVGADVLALPFADEAFGTVLAADLLHHVRDLDVAFAEIARVLRPDGVLVAWWYESAPHEAPDAPRFPRTYDEVAEHATFDVEPLDLEVVLPGGPPTVGLLGRR
jgi:ubiquinone/menaquinone biosynthesis C-methylase UbiE